MKTYKLTEQQMRQLVNIESHIIDAYYYDNNDKAQHVHTLLGTARDEMMTVLSDIFDSNHDN